jgi:hypothetical protein
MTERQAFMAAIKRMWLNLGRPESSWDAVHDWDLYFRQGARVDDAHIAFQDALQCE